jgi:molybdate transport system substrate-binding protein
MEKKLKILINKIIFAMAAIMVLISVLSGCQSQPAIPHTTQPATTSPTPITTRTTSSTPIATVTPSTTVSPHGTKEISAFAGSASKPPLDEAAALFEKQTGVKVYLTYGGSGAALSQMKLSQTGDLYIPGSPDYLAKAAKDNVIVVNSAKIMAYLIPTITVQHGNPKNIQNLHDLAKPGITVGIGNPSTVCVGLYAIEILDYNQFLPNVYKNVVTQADSCEKTATLISLKSVDAVLGWDVFHAWNPDYADSIFFEQEQLLRIAYIPAAVSTFSKDKATAEEFIDYLSSQIGQEIFKKWGYNVTEAEALKYAPGAKIGGEYQLPDSYKSLIK